VTGPVAIARRATAMLSGASAEFRAAVLFLTRVRLAPRDIDATGAAAFGLVGALIGVAGAVGLLVLGTRAPLAAAAAAVGVIAWVSGGLHLDGLADTADALAAATADAATRARKDPRVGTAGAAAIVIAVLLDTSLLAAVVERGGPLEAAGACLVATAGSRAIPPLVAVLLRRRARGGRLGSWFTDGTDARAALAAALSALSVCGGAAIIAQAPALAWGLAGGTAATLVLAGWLARARGGIDGDGFGALVELAFAAILLVTVLLG
jgi:adenosylcobinamide-GDP ribazoletransferase